MFVSPVENFSQPHCLLRSRRASFCILSSRIGRLHWASLSSAAAETLQRGHNLLSPPGHIDLQYFKFMSALSELL